MVIAIISVGDQNHTCSRTATGSNPTTDRVIAARGQECGTSGRSGGGRAAGWRRNRGGCRCNRGGCRRRGALSIWHRAGDQGTVAGTIKGWGGVARVEALEQGAEGAMLLVHEPYVMASKL